MTQMGCISWPSLTIVLYIYTVDVPFKVGWFDCNSSDQKWPMAMCNPVRDTHELLYPVPVINYLKCQPALYRLEQ